MHTLHKILRWVAFGIVCTAASCLSLGIVGALIYLVVATFTINFWFAAKTWGIATVVMLAIIYLLVTEKVDGGADGL